MAGAARAGTPVVVRRASVLSLYTCASPAGPSKLPGEPGARRQLGCSVLLQPEVSPTWGLSAESRLGSSPPPPLLSSMAGTPCILRPPGALRREYLSWGGKESLPLSHHSPSPTGQGRPPALTTCPPRPGCSKGECAAGVRVPSQERSAQCGPGAPGGGGGASRL